MSFTKHISRFFRLHFPMTVTTNKTGHADKTISDHFPDVAIIVSLGNWRRTMQNSSHYKIHRFPRTHIHLPRWKVNAVSVEKIFSMSLPNGSASFVQMVLWMAKINTRHSEIFSECGVSISMSANYPSMSSALNKSVYPFSSINIWSI